MAQQINDNFQLLAGLPIDDRIKKSTITERDAISSTRRFQGLQCFVEQTQTLYLLLGGITNSNWIGIGGDNLSNGLETVIEGFYVLLAGKTTPLDWEIGDKFRGWISDRYVVGSIVSLPVSLPSDIDDVSKVELEIDSESSVIYTIDSYDFDGDGQDYTLPTGATAFKGWINDYPQHKEKAGFEARLNKFTQLGTTVTFAQTIETGDRITIDYNI